MPANETELEVHNERHDFQKTTSKREFKFCRYDQKLLRLYFRLILNPDPLKIDVYILSKIKAQFVVNDI